ncbi:hypothetical protein RQN30_07330 [Arcanobacterium hippocoleae]
MLYFRAFFPDFTFSAASGAINFSAGVVTGSLTMLIVMIVLGGLLVVLIVLAIIFRKKMLLIFQKIGKNAKKMTARAETETVPAAGNVREPAAAAGDPRTNPNTAQMQAQIQDTPLPNSVSAAETVEFAESQLM